MGNKSTSGIFVPAVKLVRAAVGKAKFNQLRGKGISLHSQGNYAPWEASICKFAQPNICMPWSRKQSSFPGTLASDLTSCLSGMQLSKALEKG